MKPHRLPHHLAEPNLHHHRCERLRLLLPVPALVRQTFTLPSHFCLLLIHLPIRLRDFSLRCHLFPVSRLTDTLCTHEGLAAGHSLTSLNGIFTLSMRRDGNLVLFCRGYALFNYLICNSLTFFVVCLSLSVLFFIPFFKLCS